MAEGVTDFQIFTRNAKHVSAIILLCVLIEVALSSDPKQEIATGGGVSEGIKSINATNTTKGTIDEEGGKGNKGVIIAVCVIGAVVCLVAILGVYLFKRRRQSMMMDKEKKMQIQMSSARNAGVYQDLTVSVPADEKPPASPEHERLKAAEDA